MRRSLATFAAAMLVAAGGVAAVSMSAANAAAGCKVAYKVVNQWSGGFQSDVAITNLGDPLTSWKLEFDFPDAGQKVGSGWNATWSQSGAHVTATSLSYNGALATNATTSGIGFTGTFTASNPVPSAFKLNGVTCTGSVTATPTPSVTPTVTPTPTPTVTPTVPPGAAPKLHVSGNKIVNASGQAVRLLGANRSGGEFACIQGNGIWNGPMDDASINAMAAWKIRTVRVPLNEECWLGTSNVQPQYGGTTYQSEVKGYVSRLLAHGITPIVEMHWSYGTYTGTSSACTDVHASCQKPMPDAQYAPGFWTSVANTFKGDTAIVFDLFNEPYPERATGSAASGWTCWRNGGTCPGIGYQVAGMQTLVDTVRATGAQNVILLGGLAYSNDLTGWLANKPADATGNLAAAWHSYNFNTCSSQSCWDSQLAPVAAQVPLVAGEIGENDCAHGYIDGLMNWLDQKGLSYLAWTWNNWDCSSGPSLITDWNGTATNYGAGFKAHLATQ
ncbi:cellulase family glycosylhydrolase [Sphaerisporangium sp. NBC_01403]|uniref:cellulase family glycosylhydrolase n=1 Tax=Sphaerisporangium sp. NBC_01403 TaxID=2903599 RepID=UPI00386A42EF